MSTKRLLDSSSPVANDEIKKTCKTIDWNKEKKRLALLVTCMVCKDAMWPPVSIECANKMCRTVVCASCSLSINECVICKGYITKHIHPYEVETTRSLLELIQPTCIQAIESQFTCAVARLMYKFKLCSIKFDGLTASEALPFCNLFQKLTVTDNTECPDIQKQLCQPICNAQLCQPICNAQFGAVIYINIRRSDTSGNFADCSSIVSVNNIIDIQSKLPAKVIILFRVTNRIFSIVMHIIYCPSAAAMSRRDEHPQHRPCNEEDKEGNKEEEGEMKIEFIENPQGEMKLGIIENPQLSTGPTYEVSSFRDSFQQPTVTGAFYDEPPFTNTFSSLE